MSRLPNLIALCGPAQSGKSTCADELATYYGYTLVKFAGPLKDMLRSLGLTEAQIEGNQKEIPCTFLNGKSPRQAMQTLGTEWGRDLIGRDLWVNAWTARCNQIIRLGGRVVVDDCRFDNELQAIRALGGKAVKLWRPGIEAVNGHISENALNDHDLPVVPNIGDTFMLVESVINAVSE